MGLRQPGSTRSALHVSNKQKARFVEKNDNHPPCGMLSSQSALIQRGQTASKVISLLFQLLRQSFSHPHGLGVCHWYEFCPETGRM